MPKKKSEYHEIEGIKDDLESLKSNVIELTRHLQENSANRAQELQDRARKNLSTMQNQGKRRLHKVERRIKSHPTQSMVMAFIGGMMASLLLNGRR